MDKTTKKPKNILKLDETVVNRIAAGEIIQRPANALKEMLENSLDAGSTSIQVTVKDGGLKLLKIQDNGSGINKEDFAIVCERFTTSKLQKFEDLNAIGTFGFRGEALASISHVAHLTIITKTVEMQCAYKSSYHNGKLVGASKPCAGTQGTQIVVEDLFYNVPTRRNALKSPSDEHNRIIEVITRFAVHNASVGFSLKKLNDNGSDVRTSPNSTQEDNIRILYGHAVAKDLIKLNVEDPVLKVKVNGLISNVDYAGAKFTMLLFINHRLVDSTPLKRALDSVYATYLAKGKHPFVYLSIEIAPNCVDVNVHPTKHEVHFLNEDAIIHKIQSTADILLKNASTSRSFAIQTVIPPSNFLNKPESRVTNSNATKVYDKQLVRTDSKDQKIDKFLDKSTTAPESMMSSLDQSSFINQTSVEASYEPSISVNQRIEAERSEVPDKVRTIPREPEKNNSTISHGVIESITERRNFELTSLSQLREAVKNNTDQVLRDTFKDSIFVGCVSEKHCLIQHGTRLYIFCLERVAEEFFYQRFLEEFGNCGVICLSDPPPLYNLALMAMDQEDNEWRPEDGPKDYLGKQVAELLGCKSEMLNDYFSIQIEGNRNLAGIPLVLVGYIPDLTQLPSFVLRLASDVEWNVEKDCFDTVCRVMAKFYRKPNDHEVLNVGSDKDWKWTVEHVLYPAIKASLLPPKAWISDGTILQIADLPDLYKVFERC
ncbi:DNA mismatch repair protein Mlh1-like [Daphnia pulicaria]|uniref:DNA mismatch repair protein Mlh1-like n=1 Tax=Daphnia pulicaria TaxID=35523 RepID=UPI001EECE627|nr:DNA mismatch repair protein Mlh1-like [Daphnia pulicaria]